MIEYSDIKRVASAAGFDLCGVTTARPLVAGEVAFREWLNAGYASSLEYMHRNCEKRFDAARLVEGARSVVVCAVRYKLLQDKAYHAESRTKIASYACRRDYHKSVKKMLQQMLKSLQTEYPQLQGRAFVDSEPLSEKQYAVEAGLGWIGRQSLLVTPQYGSALLLGVLLLDDEVSRYDRRYEGVGCGECRRCVDACPTNAIMESRGVDTLRCISCHTIEAESHCELDLCGWIFGCDECQLCCPYNKNQIDSEGEVCSPEFLPSEISAGEWLAMSEEDFALRFGSTPLKRSGLRRIQQNVIKNKGV